MKKLDDEKVYKLFKPELNKSGDMYAKYTIEGERFQANVYTGFDREEELKKLEEKRIT